MAEPDELMGVEDLAGLLGASKDYVYHLRMRGQGPPGFKLGTGRGSPIRFRRSAVEKWLKEYEKAETERLQRMGVAG